MADMIKAIVGLGNPGPSYTCTRHNAGFWFVDILARQLGVTLRADQKTQGLLADSEIAGHRCRLLQPLCYMNHSGASVAALANYYKLLPRELLIVYDDLDLAPGVARFKSGGGHGGHNGLRDIAAALGSVEFQRLRIGIGRPGDKSQVVDYVLTRPSVSDREAIDDAMASALSVIERYVAGATDEATKHLHTLRAN